MAKRYHPRAETYRDAASERCSDAAVLLEAGHATSAIWLTGLAVESLFRGYHRRLTDQLDTGHDLKALYKKSRFADHVTRAHGDDMAKAVSEVVGSWKHRFRYDPARAIRRSLGIQARSSLRNDRELTRKATEIVDAADRIVKYGVCQWPTRR